MNSVRIVADELSTADNQGAIYLDPDGDPYILSTVAEGFVAICLTDGNHWREPIADLNHATAGLNLLAREAEITVKVRGKDAPSGD